MTHDQSAVAVVGVMLEMTGVGVVKVTPASGYGAVSPSVPIEMDVNLAALGDPLLPGVEGARPACL